MKIGDLMTRDFTYVGPGVNLKECAKVMIKKRVGSLIVKEGDNLRGILTEKDIVWAVSKKSKRDLEDIHAEDLMKRKIVTIRPSADIIEAMKKFKKEINIGNACKEVTGTIFQINKLKDLKNDYSTTTIL